MELVDCQNYTALKVDYLENYALYDDDIDDNEYSTTDDELICNVENVPYCYIGNSNGKIYCNRVRQSLEKYYDGTHYVFEDYYDTIDISDKEIFALRDLVAYGEVLPPIKTVIHTKDDWNEPIYNIEQNKPKYYDELKAGTNWMAVDTLDMNNIYWLLNDYFRHFENEIEYVGYMDNPDYRHIITWKQFDE